MNKSKLTEKELKLLQSSQQRLDKINRYMPYIIGLLSITFLVYFGMLFKVGVIDGVIKIMYNVKLTSLWINQSFAYPKFMVLFWRLFLVSGFLFILILITIGFWYEMHRHLKIIIKLSKKDNEE